MDELKPLISIIVPVYEVEGYLNRCVDSILLQTYKNLQIILVDDGSTDTSGLICDNYAINDNRVIVVHKENGGLSDARNTGLELISGEYVSFIDSDDFVSPFYIENLYNAIRYSDSDISSSWFINFYEGNNVNPAIKLDLSKIAIMNRVMFFEKMLYQEGVEVCAWGKLYKVDCFKDIRYPKGKLYEDIPVTYRVVENAEKIAVIPNIDYFYYQRSTGIARSPFNINKMDAITHMEDLKGYMIKVYPELKSAAICRYFSTVCNILMQIREEDFSREKARLWNEIKKYRKSVLIDKKGRKKARIAAAISYFGFIIMQYTYNKIQ